VLLTNMTRNCLIFEDGSTDNQQRFGNTNVHSNILPRMRKPLSFTQCGQAAAARLTISSMLHIYPHAPGGGGLSVRNFATTTIEL
jgi:hypothetical protein